MSYPSGSPSTVDCLIAGAAGQIGRHILACAIRSGADVAVWARRDVRDELNRITGIQPSQYSLYIGSAYETDLPTAHTVINAAGLTKWGRTDLDDYLRANVGITSWLSRHAYVTGGHYHHLSTMAVAGRLDGCLVENASDPLSTATYRPIDTLPDLRPYVASKVIAELVGTLYPRSHLYRVCDVVPSVYRLEQDFRRDHWLSILFGHTPSGLRLDRRFYIATDMEVAKAIWILKTQSNRTPRAIYHVLGNVYNWSDIAPEPLRSVSMAEASTVHTLVAMLSEMNELPSRIAAPITQYDLHRYGFDYQQLGADYWLEFKVRARQGRILS